MPVVSVCSPNYRTGIDLTNLTTVNNSIGLIDHCR